MNTVSTKHRRIANDMLKIVMIGHDGMSGTNAITAVSEVLAINSMTCATGQDTLHRKAGIANLAYGAIHINGTEVHLYSTPAQQQFDFMAEAVMKGADGIIIMIDGTHSQALAEIDYFLHRYRAYLKKHPALIAINQNASAHHVPEYHEHIRKHGFLDPIITVDVREKTQARAMFEKLYHNIKQTITVQHEGLTRKFA